MRFTLQTIFSLLLCLFSGQALVAADYYIMYNPTCMDRMEYGYGFTPETMSYVKYQIKISPSEVLVLEVGPENQSSRQNYLSSSTITCGSEVFRREMINQIRGNVDKVFIVRPTDGQYQVTKVNAASFFRRDNQGILYDSKDFSFDRIGGLNIGDNLTKNDPNGINVTYQGLVKYQCADAYLFRQTFTFNPNMYREIYFLPGIGVVEERPSTGDPKEIYSLRRVNNEAFSSFLQRYCASSMNLSSNFLRNNSATATDNSWTTNTGNPVLTSRGVSTTTSTNNPGFHDVERGETLYSIARRYGVSVDQLRQWNNMGNSNILAVGQRLRVAPPTGVDNSGIVSNPPAQQPLNNNNNWNNTNNNSNWNNANSNSNNNSNWNNTNNNGNNSNWNANNSNSNWNTNNNTGNQVDNNATLTPRGDSRFAWNTTNGWHTVAAGETVALLAMRYGYTEARFRDLNKLAPADYLKVGQRLRTTDCPPSTGSTPQQQQQQPQSGWNNQGVSPNSNTNSQPSPYGYNNTNPAGNTNVNLQNSGGSNFNNAPVNAGFEPYQSYGYAPAVDNSASASSNQQSARGVNAAPSSGGIPQNYNYNNTDYGSGLATRGAADAGMSGSNFGTPVSPGSLNTGAANNTAYPNGLPPRNYDFNYGANGKATATNTQAKTVNAAPNGKRTSYTVKDGDTLESIARKFNTTVDYLRQVNSLGPREVVIPFQNIYLN